MKLARRWRLLRQRSSRGQAALEYVLVISVLSIAVYYSTAMFVELFGQGMDTLTGSLSTSLTDDGIRP